MTKTILIAFPYAGGSATIYQPLEKCLANEIELVSIELPGRGKRFLEQPLLSINEMVDEAFNWFCEIQPKKYALFGYSMGSILAYEFYYKLLQNGFSSPQHIFFAACEHIGKNRKSEGISVMTDSDFCCFLEEKNGTPEEVFENQELLELILPYVRGDFLALDTYKYNPRNFQIDCNVTVLSGRKDNIPKGNILLWNEYVQNKCQFETIEGDHFFIRESYTEVAEIINKALL
ncbi:thioesterase domain-containing protein [Lysinibacillus xylanilyticus]|uniref:thioesterase II family protein n=1 Tax=Lysinibacillus xylanilyticus TaxID=582475 RepID=UPI002E23B855|nr:thioesterase domain-containing protein [Lysinibacillus xylanilyticus]